MGTNNGTATVTLTSYKEDDVMGDFTSREAAHPSPMTVWKDPVGWWEVYRKKKSKDASGVLWQREEM